MQGIVECKLGVLKQDIQYNLYYKALNKTRTRPSQTRVNLQYFTTQIHAIHIIYTGWHMRTRKRARIVSLVSKTVEYVML